MQTPGGLIFGGAIKLRVFRVAGLGGLYWEGLIHGGAYFRNFTVFLLNEVSTRYASATPCSDRAVK